MPFLALAGPALAGALGVTSTLGTAAIGAGLGAAGTLAQNSLTKPSSTGPGQVNIDQLNEQTKAISRQNAIDSANLEKQLTPEVPQLRTAANNAVLQGLTPSAGYNASTGSLLSQIQNNGNTPLLQAAIAKAMSDLQLGGKLGVDQQNLVTRGALANAGAVGGGGLGLGRDLVARDLGLSSLNLEQNRLQNAIGLGNTEQQNQFQRISLLDQLQRGNFGQSLAAAQYGQSIQQPNVGLDPSAAANIAIGNNNAYNAYQANRANISGQQNQNLLQAGGQLLGYGLLDYNNGRGGSGSGGGAIYPSSGTGLGQTYNPGISNKTPFKFP